MYLKETIKFWKSIFLKLFTVDIQVFKVSQAYDNIFRVCIAYLNDHLIYLLFFVTAIFIQQSSLLYDL